VANKPFNPNDPANRAVLDQVLRDQLAPKRAEKAADKATKELGRKLRGKK
jgi:hypothetical protein